MGADKVPPPQPARINVRGDSHLSALSNTVLLLCFGCVDELYDRLENHTNKSKSREKILDSDDVVRRLSVWPDRAML